MPQPLQIQPQNGSNAGTTVASVDGSGNETLAGNLTVGGGLFLQAQGPSPPVQQPGQVALYTADGKSLAFVGAGGQPVGQAVSGNETVAGSLGVGTTALGVAGPVNHGVAAWSFDPSLAFNSSLLTNGTVYLTRLDIAANATVTKLLWWISAVGASPAAGQNQVGLYSSAGTLLASAVVDSAITSTGLVTTTIAGQALVAGSFYWVGMVFNAATAPTLSRGTGNPGTATACNMGLAASALRYATNGTGASALPASITPASNAALNFAGPWAAVG